MILPATLPDAFVMTMEKAPVSVPELRTRGRALIQVGPWITLIRARVLVHVLVQRNFVLRWRAGRQHRRGFGGIPLHGQQVVQEVGIRSIQESMQEWDRKGVRNT